MIRFLLTGDSSSLQKAAKDARAELNSLKGTTDVTTKGVVAFGAATAAAATVGLVVFTAKGLEAIDAQAKLARAVGGTTEGMQVLERAAGRAGVSSDELRAAATRLNQKLGEAIRNGGDAAKTFSDLGLDAEKLSQMDVDARFSAIAKAASDMKLSTAETALALREMGIRQSSVITLMQGGEPAITASRKAVDAYGIALSEVDAAQVEAANDAFGEVGVLLDGLQKKFAVEVAPVIQALSEMFTEAAVDAGGVGDAATSAFDMLVNGAAFAMNAFDGLKRVGSLVLDSIIKFVSEGGVAIDKFALGVVETLDKIPGVDLSSSVVAIKADLAEVEAFSATASQRIDDALNKPLAGDKFKQFVADAKAAAKEAAEATVAERPEQKTDFGPTEEEIKAAEEAAKRKADADAKALEAEKAQLASRIEAIRQANMTEAEMADSKYAAELEALKAYAALGDEQRAEAAALSAGAAQRYSDEKLAIDQRRADQELRIEEQKEAAKRQILSGALSGLTSLMNSGSRKLFEIGKVAAISQAIVSTITGATKALELGFPLGPIAASAISLAGFANVDAIRSQQFGGGSANKGGTAAPSVTQSVNAQTTPVASPNESRIFVEGVDPSALYTGSAMRNLAEKLVEFSRGGGNTSVQFA